MKESYEDELREDIDILEDTITAIQNICEDIEDNQRIGKELALDLRNAINGYDDMLEEKKKELEEIEQQEYEQEMKERNREYNKVRL